MRTLIQRVSHASVVVEGQTVGAIEAGLLALVGVDKGDQIANAERMVTRLLNYRVFPDEAGKMNLSIADIRGGLLLVPQFTLAADTKKGTRPSFSSAAAPDNAQILFKHVVELAKRAHPRVETGIFGAEMHVHLTNHGPVTFLLEA